MSILEMPLVSVITPVFNGEKYIRRTIESVLSQNYPKIEFIVVDGASTDSTLSIISSYSSKIDLVISESDLGMYDAINKGVQRSTGSILCYINSDDYYFPDTIERVIPYFIAKRSQLVFGNCIYVDKNEHELYRYSGVNLPYSLVRRFGRIPFAQQTSFWTRDLYFEVGGFDLKYKYVADTKFLYECLRLADKKTSHINEFISSFRQHDDAFSTNAYREMAIEHDLVIKDLCLDIYYWHHLIDTFIKMKNYRNFIRRCF